MLFLSNGILWMVTLDNFDILITGICMNKELFDIVMLLKLHYTRLTNVKTELDYT
jgi:hypothetical protein